MLAAIRSALWVRRYSAVAACLFLGTALVYLGWATQPVGTPAVDLAEGRHYRATYAPDPVSRPSRPPTEDEIRRPRVVVAMATFKQEVGPTLQSLLIGATVRPDVVYVLVPKQVRHYGISQVDVEPQLLELRDQMNQAISSSNSGGGGGSRRQADEVVRVMHVDDNGGNTKLLPVLRVEHDPYTLIITVDDDVVYGPDLVSRFVEHAGRRPDWALHMACENFTADGGLLRSSKRLHDVAGPCMFGTGAWGNAFRRWFFDANALEDLARGPAGCFIHDDIWLAGNLWERDIPKFKIHCPDPACFISHKGHGKQIHTDRGAHYDRNTCANFFNFFQPKR